MRVSVRVHGPKGHRDVEMIVDTGATYTKLSPSLARELGITPRGAIETTLADGRKSKAGLTNAVVECYHSKKRVPVIIQEGDILLLGATTLKALRLRVNPVDGKLEPTSLYVSRAGWLLVYVALFFGLSLFTYYADSQNGTLLGDYYIGKFVLVVLGAQVPIPLIVYSLVFALVIFIPVRILGWGVSQALMKHYAKGILAFILLVLIVGFAVSYSPYQTLIPPTSVFYHDVQGILNSL